MNKQFHLLIVGGGGNEEYTSPHIINDVGNDYSLSLYFSINNMSYFAEKFINNYYEIIAYPNNSKYNMDTKNAIDFSYSFANMYNCKDTIKSIYDRFNWNSCTNMKGAFDYCYNLTGNILKFSNKNITDTLSNFFFNLKTKPMHKEKKKVYPNG